MMTVEVLVAMLILFLAIAMSMSSIRFLSDVEKRKEAYQNRYMTVLSLKDKLTESCLSSQSQEGNFNGHDYRVQCTKLKELKNFHIALDTDDVSGNYGSYLMQLYQMELFLMEGTREHRYAYYITKNRVLK